jgi:hypothetical protein
MLRPISNKHSQLTQGAHFQSHMWPVNQRIQKARGSRLTSLIHLYYAFICAAPHIKSKGLPIDVPYSSILCFLHAQCRIQKSRGSWLTYLIVVISNTFCSHKASRSLLTYHCTFHTTIFIDIWKARGIYISISTRHLAKSKEKCFIY